MGYPLRLPTDLLLRHPQANRCQTLRTKEATHQVTVTLRSPLLPQLSLDSWGNFYLRSWMLEPLRCYRCHCLCHHQTSCASIIKCGMCSESHETQECLVKNKAKQNIVHRCPNCNRAHHAWNKSCPARLRLVERSRERQAAWVVNQQKSETIPASPGTFVWGLLTAPPPAPRPAPTDFSSLPPTAAAPRQPPMTNLPSRRPPRTTRSTQTIAPLCTSLSSPRIISSPQQVFCTCSNLTPVMSPQSSTSACSEETCYYLLPAESFQAIGKELANGLSLTLVDALRFPVSPAIFSQAIQIVIDKYLDMMKTCSNWNVEQLSSSYLHFTDRLFANPCPSL